MKAKRRHDLKHDPLADTLGRLWEMIVRHRVRVLLGAVLLAVVTGLVTGILASAAMARGEANARFARIEEETRLLFYQRRQDPEAASKTAKTAIEACRGIAREMPSTAAAARALVRAGQLLNGEGQREAAIRTFQEAIDRSREWPGLLRLAREGLAASLERAGKYVEAASIYEQLARSETRAVVAQRHWDMGRCLELAGRRSQAVAAYRRAVEADRLSRWAELAMARTRALAEEREPTAETLTSEPSRAKEEAGKSEKGPPSGTEGPRKTAETDQEKSSGETRKELPQPEQREPEPDSKASAKE